MKTVAIVLNTSWNIYNFRLNLMKRLQLEGYRVVALSPYDTYADKLKEEGFEWFELSLDNDSTNLGKELLQIIRFYKLYRKVSPDIVLHYTIKPNLYGTFSAYLLKISSINNISGLGTVFVKDKFVYKLARMLYRVILRFPEKVFFQNHYDSKLFISKKLVKKYLVDVLPGSGIDIKRFVPLPSRKENMDKIVFLMIARLIKDKGLIEYISAIRILKKQYSNAQFKLIGSLYEGNPSAISKEELDSWIDEELIEYLPFSDNMEDVISKVDCVVLPSYREGLSRVLLEAASMGKAIVTTNVAGCKDVVDDGYNGFLCEVRNAEDLAKKMEKMILLSNDSRFLMGKRGRDKIVKEFDENIVIEKYLCTIQNIFQKSELK